MRTQEECGGGWKPGASTAGPGGGGAECTASGVPRETFQTGDLTSCQIVAPAFYLTTYKKKQPTSKGNRCNTNISPQEEGWLGWPRRQGRGGWARARIRGPLRGSGRRCTPPWRCGGPRPPRVPPRAPRPPPPLVCGADQTLVGRGGARRHPKSEPSAGGWSSGWAAAPDWLQPGRAPWRRAPPPVPPAPPCCSWPRAAVGPQPPQVPAGARRSAWRRPRTRVLGTRLVTARS